MIGSHLATSSIEGDQWHDTKKVALLNQYHLVIYIKTSVHTCISMWAGLDLQHT